MSHGFHLVPAYSVVALAEKLAERLAEREDPFAPETVLVTNFAQRVWLRRFLAERLGVCANVEFLSPESFLEKLVSHRGAEKIFGRGALAWRIFAALRRGNAGAAFTEPGMTDAAVFRLASGLGDLFWRYQSFRPEMIREWTLGVPAPASARADFLRERRRQEKLWRELDFGDATPPALAWLRLLESATPPAGVPARLFAFAPSALPRLHAELLLKLSESADVFLYYHNLSGDLWTETPEEKIRLRERTRKKKPARDEPELPGLAADADSGAAAAAAADNDASLAAGGNELLASWGKAARPLAKFLVDLGALDAFSTIDAPPRRDSLLHALQREIRDNAPVPAPFSPEKNDASLRILIAPSPAREMEILREELTARFAADPTLRPRDVIVALADVEAYRPFIRAAFENSGIPFSIADRAGTEIFPAAKAFLGILRAASGEFRLDEILDLLDLEAVRAGIALREDEVGALRAMFTEAGVRWGTNAEFRRERVFGGVPVAENVRGAAARLAENNSWAFGLRRLALGFMLGSEGDDVPALAFGENVVARPFADLREEAPLALGKFFRLLKKLAQLNAAFDESDRRSVSAWCALLQSVLADDLLDAGNGEAEIIREALAAVRDAAKRAGVPAAGTEEPECTLETLRVALEAQDWSSGRGAGGMLRGKVTFCRMTPMRNIPARVICVAGLSDGAFPRQTFRDARDLMNFGPENFPAGTARWDRSPRDDDCLLFLESILAAQDALLLSYVGRDAAAGLPLPPCPPLEKLRGFLLELVPAEKQNGETRGAPAFEILHRLHGFAPEYFSAGGKLRSFSRENYAVARRRAEAETGTGTAKIPEPNPGDGNAENAEKTPRAHERPAALAGGVPAEISRKNLTEFFTSPANFACRRILDIARERRTDAPTGDDPEELFSPLDVARFHSALFARRLAELERRGESGGASAAGGGNADENEIADAALLRAAAEFHASELTAGRVPALTEAGDYERSLADAVKDANALYSALPEKLVRVPAEALPPLVFDVGARDDVPVRVSPDFGELFRDENGRLFLPLRGRKKFDWRCAAETVVAAALLAEAFPRERFAVAYFAYGENAPHVVSAETFPHEKLSARKLVEFYARGISCAPPLFEKIPFDKKSLDSEEEFFEKFRDAWRDGARSREELFIFGENAPEDFRSEISEIVFPFVRAVQDAFARERDSDAQPARGARSRGNAKAKTSAKPTPKTRARAKRNAVKAP